MINACFAPFVRGPPLAGGQNFKMAELARLLTMTKVTFRLDRQTDRQVDKDSFWFKYFPGEHSLSPHFNT